MENAVASKALKRSSRLIILGALATLVMAGCGGGQSGGGSENSLRVGVNVALSGPGAYYGLPLLYTWQVLADQYNSRGGLLVEGTRYKIEVVSGDNRWDPATIRRIASDQILKEEVDVVVTAGDPQDPIIVPLTERNNVILLDWTSNTNFLSPPYKYVLDGLQTPNNISPPFFREIRKRHPDIRTAYGVGVDLTYDHKNVGWSEDAARKQGIEWLGTVFYPVNTQDYSPYLSRAVNADPDMIVFGSESGATPALLKTLEAIDYRGVVGSAAAPEDLSAHIKGAGEDANGFYQVEVHSWPETRALQSFKAAYGKKAGNWNALAPAHWISARFLLRAIQNAGTVSDKDAIMEAAESTRVTDPLVPGAPRVGLGGEKTYGQPRQLEAPVALNQASAGRPVTRAVLRVPVP